MRAYAKASSLPSLYKINSLSGDFSNSNHFLASLWNGIRTPPFPDEVGSSASIGT